MSFSLFCTKSVKSWMRRFWAKKYRRDHLQSLWRSVVLVTVRRWQRSAAAEGRWGSLTKCGITKLVTVRRGSDGPSCRFVVKIWELILVPRFQELKCFGTRPSTNRCAYDGLSYLPSRGMKIAAEEIAQVWDDGVHDDPSWPWRSVAWSVDPAAFWQISRD